jgi:hypothetical protein
MAIYAEYFLPAISGSEVKRMQQEHEQMNRRGFLRLSSAGAAVAGAKPLFPSLASPQEKAMELTDRTPPANPIRLHSSAMEVVLDRNDGVPFAFHLAANGATLRGEDFGRKVVATVGQKTPWRFLALETSPVNIKTTPDTVDCSSIPRFCDK